MRYSPGWKARESRDSWERDPGWPTASTHGLVRGTVILAYSIEGNGDFVKVNAFERARRA